MIFKMQMSSMSLLWPTVGSDDSGSMDSDSERSLTEETLKIISKPNLCLHQHRKMITLYGEKIPFTLQVFSPSTNKEIKAVSICVFDRGIALDLGVMMFFGKDQPHEGIDWWKVIAQFVSVQKIDGKLDVGWKSGQ